MMDQETQKELTADNFVTNVFCYSSEKDKLLYILESKRTFIQTIFRDKSSAVGKLCLKGAVG